MTALDLDLARAIVALPGFRVQDGTLWRNDNGETRRVVDGDDDFAWAFVREHEVVREFSEEHARTVWTTYGPWLPDYRDPATAGCLAELLGPGVVRLAPGGAALARAVGGPAETGACRGEAIARALVALGRCPGGRP